MNFNEEVVMLSMMTEKQQNLNNTVSEFEIGLIIFCIIFVISLLILLKEK